MSKAPSKSSEVKQTRNREKWCISTLKDENNNITESGWERIESLTKLIIRKHFSNISIKQEIRQEGVIKAAEIIKLDPENGVYKNFRTYLYTCIRNEISNFLYHTHKRTKEFDIETSNCKVTFTHKNIDNQYVEIVFKKLPSQYLKYKNKIEKLINFFSESDDSEIINIKELFNSDFSVDNKTKEELFLMRENILTSLSDVEKQIIIFILYEIKKSSVNDH